MTNVRLKAKGREKKNLDTYEMINYRSETPTQMTSEQRNGLSSISGGEYFRFHKK